MSGNKVHSGVHDEGYDHHEYECDRHFHRSKPFSPIRNFRDATVPSETARAFVQVRLPLKSSDRVGYDEGIPDGHLERERKFDVPGDFQLPDLSGAQHDRFLLRATYYDTEDALLQARGVTLRRRLGGSDEGWHLKLPHPEGRLELQTDVGPSRPPRELGQLVRGLRFDRPLRRQAVVRTKRDAYRLCAADGALVAEVADDQVAAVGASPEDATRWREVEIELGPAGSADAMDRLVDLMVAAGATPSAYGSKYDHAVGERTQRPGLSGAAGHVDDYLQTQYQEVTLGDLRMRRGENAVHKTRVALRRIRSTLRVFAPLFDPKRATELDRELVWYAEALGRVRDMDIVGRWIAGDIEAAPESLIDQDMGRSLLRTLDTERRRAWTEVLAILDGRRYGALLRQLDEWRREVPWSPDADADIESLVRKAKKKSDRRLNRATSRKGAPDAAFHQARKAAKRTRYAAELAQPAVGKSTKQVAATYAKRQDALGEVQDHAMVIATLRRVAASPTTTSEVGFVCGVLTERHLRAKAAARASQG